MSKKIEKGEVEKALNTFKEQKEKEGIIPKSNKKIVLMDNGVEDFSGMTLKITKGVIKNDVYYSYKAGTNWEAIDAFGKKNIRFNISDFKIN